MAMKRIGVAELKDHLSSHLRAVERGEEVEVTDRNRPIARIVPVGSSRAVPIAPARRPFSSIRDRRYPPANWPVSSTDLLLEDRRTR
jgi:prevent-host-death family protein